ncbi:transposable element Tcb2 transposase [Trichonephila clavipes]|nr:transposable element Tcb2 transposase [Trichonephila clavipes]
MWCLFHCKQQLHTPPQSPDINVIENWWATLETAVQKHQIRNKAHLKQVLQEEWDKISPDTTKKLVESVPRRLEDIIKAKGHATKYWHCLLVILANPVASASSPVALIQLEVLECPTNSWGHAVAEWYRYRGLWLALPTGSSPAPLKTRRVGQSAAMHAKSVGELETSLPRWWCGGGS